MLSDIEIAKQAKMLKIGEVAAKLGISEDEYEPYGQMVSLFLLPL